MSPQTLLYKHFPSQKRKKTAKNAGDQKAIVFVNTDSKIEENERKREKTRDGKNSGEKRRSGKPLLSSMLDRGGHYLVTKMGVEKKGSLETLIISKPMGGFEPPTF
jgi:hypothetical protein